MLMSMVVVDDDQIEEKVTEKVREKEESVKRNQ